MSLTPPSTARVAATAPNVSAPPKAAPVDPATIVRAPAVLLCGPPGTGKTYALSTLLEAGLKVFVISTEPGGLETLIDACISKRIPFDNLHYRSIQPARNGFDTLEAMATTVSKLSYEHLSKMQPTTRTNASFITVLSCLRDFRCDRTGIAFGDVSKLGPDSALVIDSLSGLSVMAMDNTIGDKVTAHQGEWGVAMGLLDKFILTCTSNLTALFVLTSHVEPEADEIGGGSKLMVSTLGRKLAPKLPRFFSEVVLCSTEGDKFFWNTTHPRMDLKHRSLPLGAKLPPNFKPIVEAYKKRLEAVKTVKT